MYSTLSSDHSCTLFYPSWKISRCTLLCLLSLAGEIVTNRFFVSPLCLNSWAGKRCAILGIIHVPSSARVRKSAGISVCVHLPGRYEHAKALLVCFLLLSLRCCHVPKNDTRVCLKVQALSATTVAARLQKQQQQQHTQTQTQQQSFHERSNGFSSRHDITSQDLGCYISNGVKKIEQGTASAGAMNKIKRCDIASISGYNGNASPLQPPPPPPSPATAVTVTLVTAGVAGSNGIMQANGGHSGGFSYSAPGAVHRMFPQFCGESSRCDTIEAPGAEPAAMATVAPVTVTLEAARIAARHMRETFGLSIFGFDLVVDGVTGEMRVIDVNYFPSFKDLEDFPQVGMNYVTILSIELYSFNCCCFINPLGAGPW